MEHIQICRILLPIIHNKEEKAIQLAQSVIDQFDEIWENKYYGMMLKKVGIKNNNKKLYPLIDEILNYMQKNKKIIITLFCIYLITVFR